MTPALKDLPPELVLRACGQLHHKDLVRLSSCSKTLLHLTAPTLRVRARARARWQLLRDITHLCRKITLAGSVRYFHQWQIVNPAPFPQLQRVCDTKQSLSMITDIHPGKEDDLIILRQWLSCLRNAFSSTLLLEAVSNYHRIVQRPVPDKIEMADVLNNVPRWLLVATCQLSGIWFELLDWPE